MTENVAALRPRYGEAIGTVRGGVVIFNDRFEKFIDALIRANSNSQEEPGAVFIPSIGQIIGFIDQELTTATADIRTQRNVDRLSGEVSALKALLKTERQKGDKLSKELESLKAQVRTERQQHRALEQKLNQLIAEVQTNG